jgi:hypothetical protein
MPKNRVLEPIIASVCRNVLKMYHGDASYNFKFWLDEDFYYLVEYKLLPVVYYLHFTKKTLTITITLTFKKKFSKVN